MHDRICITPGDLVSGFGINSESFIVQHCNAGLAEDSPLGQFDGDTSTAVTGVGGSMVIVFQVETFRDNYIVNNVFMAMHPSDLAADLTDSWRSPEILKQQREF